MESEENKIPKTRSILLRAYNPEIKFTFVSIPVETDGTDAQIKDYLEMIGRQLKKIRTRPSAYKATNPLMKNCQLDLQSKMPRIAIYVKNLETGEEAEPFVFPMAQTVNQCFDILVDSGNLVIEHYKPHIYDWISRQLDIEHLDIYTVSQSDFEEICAMYNPMFDSPYWTDKQRRQFMQLAKAAIKMKGKRASTKAKSANIEIKQQKNNSFTKALLSAKNANQCKPVRTSIKSGKNHTSNKLTKSKNVAVSEKKINQPKAGVSQKRRLRAKEN